MAVQLICYMDEGEKNLGFVCVCVCLSKKLSQMKEILSHTDYCFSFTIFIYLFTVGSVEGFALADMH